VLAASGEARERALRTLTAAGIESRPMFAPLHRQRPYLTGDALPVTDEIAARGLLLPCGSRLSRSDVEEVVRTLP
jgi:perosamine synthetase